MRLIFILSTILLMLSVLSCESEFTGHRSVVVQGYVIDSIQQTPLDSVRIINLSSSDQIIDTIYDELTNDSGWFSQVYFESKRHEIIYFYKPGYRIDSVIVVFDSDQFPLIELEFMMVEEK